MSGRVCCSIRSDRSTLITRGKSCSAGGEQTGAGAEFEAWPRGQWSAAGEGVAQGVVAAGGAGGVQVGGELKVASERGGQAIMMFVQLPEEPTTVITESDGRPVMVTTMPEPTLVTWVGPLELAAKVEHSRDEYAKGSYPHGPRKGQPLPRTGCSHPARVDEFPTLQSYLARVESVDGAEPLAISVPKQRDKIVRQDAVAQERDEPRTPRSSSRNGTFQLRTYIAACRAVLGEYPIWCPPEDLAHITVEMNAAATSEEFTGVQRDVLIAELEARFADFSPFTVLCGSPIANRAEVAA